MSETEDKTGTDMVTTERGTLKARDMKIGSAGINFTNAAEVMAFANMMSQADTAVRKQFRNNPGACLAIIDDSIRFGMSPFFLARKAYVVSGEIAYEAQAVAAIIIARAPIKDRPDYEYSGTGDAMKCKVTVETITGKRITQESPAIKDITIKNSPLWASDPQQQLGYYTVRALARRHFPDVLGGIYDVEEAQAARARDITPAQEDEPERQKSKLGAMLEAGRIAQAQAAEAAKTAPAATESVAEPAGEETTGDPTPEPEAASAPAPEPATAEPEPTKAASPLESPWNTDEQAILDELTTALAGVSDEDGIAGIAKKLGGAMKGKRKALVTRANELVAEKRGAIAAGETKASTLL